MSGITSLVYDAPPGEIDAVRQDIEALTNNSASIQRQLAADVEKANIAQLRVVEITTNGKKQLTIVSKYNQISKNEFFTAGNPSLKFTIDHLTRKTRVEGEHTLTDAASLASYQAAVDKYVAEHYASESVGAVLPSTGGNEELVVIVVGRKLNPQNFFNGQLTSVYTLDLSSNEFKGQIKADVHYFEDGNVRMDSKKTVKVSGVRSATDLGEQLEKLETEFQTKLNQHLIELNQREFKQLRRQLPVTRMPMVWGKAVAGYKLGKELENR